MSASHGVAIPGPKTDDLEVLAKATRRRFSAEYKLKVLRVGRHGGHGCRPRSQVRGLRGPSPPSGQHPGPLDQRDVSKCRSLTANASR